MSQTQNQAQQVPDQLLFTDVFKNAVRDYCEKDDERIKLQKQLKDLRSDIKGLEDVIVVFMKDNNMPMFDTGGKGMFKNDIKQQRKGISKQVIIDALKKCDHVPTDKAEEVAAYIYESRPTEEKETLIRK